MTYEVLYSNSFKHDVKLYACWENNIMVEIPIDQ